VLFSQKDRLSDFLRDLHLSDVQEHDDGKIQGHAQRQQKEAHPDCQGKEEE
jgi:hypothetical protein